MYKVYNRVLQLQYITIYLKVSFYDAFWNYIRLFLVYNIYITHIKAFILSLLNFKYIIEYKLNFDYYFNVFK